MLDEHDVSVAESRSTRKPLNDDETRELLGTVDTVLIARGKNVRSLDAADTLVDDLKGPTGNVRAPLVRRGSTLLVGFHLASLTDLVTS